jgi:hypothetical protein
MLYIPLTLSVILLVLVYGAARIYGKGSWAPLTACGCVLPIAAFFPAAAWNVIFVAGAAVGWKLAGFRPLILLLASLGATACAYTFILVGAVQPELHRWAELKDQYPMESLSDRLAYERRFERPRQSTEAKIAVPNEARLTDLEKRVESFSSHLRKACLERLHAGAVQQFINSRGFGIARFPLAGPEKLDPQTTEDRRSRERITIPQTAPPDPGDSIIHGGSEGELQTAMWQHEENALQFASAFDFGYVRDRDHVAGFVPHEFANPAAGFRSWGIDKLQLVSLLKFEAPAVYISAELPKMRELKNAKTRPLDTFESQALEALRQGEDLQVQFGPNSIRMLGSVRALKQCIKCHSVERGDLLGAFSYQLQPEHK